MSSEELTDEPLPRVPGQFPDKRLLAAVKARGVGLVAYAEIVVGSRAREAVEAAILAAREDLETADGVVGDVGDLLTWHVRRESAQRAPHLRGPSAWIRRARRAPQHPPANDG